VSFVQFSKVSLAFGDRDILKDVTINLSKGSKAALAGSNGSGKSTLMKVMAGLIEADSGDRAVQKNTRIAYLPQSGIVHTGCSLREEADKAFYFGYELNQELEEISDVLAKNQGNQESLLTRYQELQSCLEDLQWHRRSVLAEQVLVGLGFSLEDLDRNVEEFSGGWQMRIALAKVLLENPHILLLDEPTNYLDLEARTWLEEFLTSFSGGFLLVTHDRYFLDVTVTDVYELFNGNLKRYPGNYSHYEKVRQTELESLMAQYELQQAEIKKLEDFIRRFGAKATKASQAQERQKQLDKIQRIEIPENLKKIHFKFPPAPHSGKLVVKLENVSKSYPIMNDATGQGRREVIKELDLLIEKGDRLVVTGRNGAGKSTLLRLIVGQDTDYTGSISLGAGVSVGYFSQDHAELMTGSQTILEKIESEAPLELIPKVRDMLGSFLFRGDDVYKSISVLSGGEKSRLALLSLLLKPINLLVLDEPTNHLDLHSKDVLLEALKSFGGTVLFVSHDRGFIEGLATKVLELKPCQSRLFPGNYDYYQHCLLKEMQTEETEEKSSTLVVQKKEQTAGSLSYEEEKRIKAEKRKLEKEEERLLLAIETLEMELANFQEQLALPEVYSDGQKAREMQEKIEVTQNKIQETSTLWENIAEQLENFS